MGVYMLLNKGAKFRFVPPRNSHCLGRFVHLNFVLMGNRLQKSLELRHYFRSDLRVTLRLSNTVHGPASEFVIVVEGDIPELLRKIHGVTVDPRLLKMKFSSTLKLMNRTFVVLQDMSSNETGRRFTSDPLMNLISVQNDTVFFETVSCVKIDIVETNASASGLCTSAEALTDKILREKPNADFILIADNDAEFTCHQSFLSAQSGYFEARFKTDCMETRSGKLKLKLSEVGLKAFLEFVYCLRINAPKVHPSICLELLDFANEKQIPHLEQAMKNLIMESPNNWMDLDVALQLFILSVQLDSQGYVVLKNKAVQAIKRHGGDIKQSELCKELLISHQAFVLELLQSLASA